MTFAFEDIGRPDDTARVPLRTGAPHALARRREAYASGDRLGAAEILAAMGNPTDEAHVRLRAAELDGALDQVAPALAFYRSVGASALVRRAEALLAASA